MTVLFYFNCIPPLLLWTYFFSKGGIIHAKMR